MFWRVSTTILVIFLLPLRIVYGQPLVADLSQHLIGVNAGFTGAELLLFGALDSSKGNDVVVVIRGPVSDRLVRKKSRVGFVWANTKEVRFLEVPSFYYVATSKPMAQIASRKVLDSLQIGFSGLVLKQETSVFADRKGYRDGLIRNLRTDKLYHEGQGTIKIMKDKLFRVGVTFPSNVPTGTFSVTTYLFDQGRVVNVQVTPLEVSKVGMEARLYEFAHKYSALYGIGAIIVALLSGWLAGAIFRKI